MCQIPVLLSKHVLVTVASPPMPLLQIAVQPEQPREDIEKKLLTHACAKRGNNIIPPAFDCDG